MVMKKWFEYYSNEQELIDDMMLTCTEGTYWKLCRGYEYLRGFKKYYQKNGYLTERQMTQLKRLAGEVYRNVHETLKLKEVEK